MTTRPLVSILTPAYKAEPYIGQAIESVQAQTMPDWELIIVEDCSPDRTAQVVERYLDDPRIRLLRNEQNLGECGSRNRALEVARGEWITLLDADDWYEPTRLERMVEFAENTQEKIVFDIWKNYYEETGWSKVGQVSSIYAKPKTPRRFTPYEYVYGHIGGQPVIWHEHIRRHGLRYIPGVLKGGDYIFQTQVIYRAGGMWMIPDALYNYRVHPNSTIQQLKKDLSKTHALYAIMLDLPEVKQDLRLRRAVLKDYKRTLGLEMLNDFSKAFISLDMRGMLRIYREAPAAASLYFFKRIPNSVKFRLRRLFGKLSQSR